MGFAIAYIGVNMFSLSELLGIKYLLFSFLCRNAVETAGDPGLPHPGADSGSGGRGWFVLWSLKPTEEMASLPCGFAQERPSKILYFPSLLKSSEPNAYFPSFLREGF